MMPKKFCKIFCKHALSELTSSATVSYTHLALSPALSEHWNGTVVPSRAYQEGGIHEAIACYEDNVFYEILAEELSRRDMDYPEITDDNYDEIVTRMDRYMSEFELSGVDHLVLDEENA